MQIRTSCPAHNCGGRCLLVATVEDGRITRLGTDDRTEDDLASPRLVACTRGRAYLQRQYHPDRLTHPLKRVGRRGEGRFERISWDEAFDEASAEIERVRDTYGNGALFVPYGTGAYSNTNGSHLARRLFYALRRVPRHREQLQLGVHQPRHAHRLRHAHHRQPAPGLGQREVHPHVGLEPRGDDRRHELRLLREAGARARRPGRLHRSAKDPERGRARRRVGADPARAPTPP